VDPSMMGGDGSGDGGMGMEAETMASFGAGGAAALGAAAGAGGMMAPPPTEFDPIEVFGPEAVAGAAPADGGSGGGEGGGDMSGMMGMAALPQALRWVALADGSKFRERGFYLSVVINQQKIPDFLVYLCESAWPTQVLKFQMGPNPYRKDGG